MHLIPCAFLSVLIFPVVLLQSPDILHDCLPVVVCLLPVAFGNGSNNVRITVMAAVHASLLAKDINNNILAALPVEKMSAQALYNQRSIVQPGLISDLEEEVQHLIRFVALDGRTESGGPLWCFPGVIPVVTQFCPAGCTE
ncbi:hypothetical protein AI3013V2_4717 (plasmid) [Enterobacter cloacae]|nr:hypothetical protein AI3013V2_4717 [Enterobacter cloacae]CAH5759076.1 hypothetical protein AI3013V2_4717 [Enterobacter cloacae]